MVKRLSLHTDSRLLRAFGMAMGLSEVPPDASVSTLPQWDSLAHVTLILALEEQFGVSFSPEDAIAMLSVAEIERVLATKSVAAG